jgi:putative ATP-dependent endonuclease of OLD family
MTNAYVKAFFGTKTFEYNLALISANRPTMLAALKEINPIIGTQLEKDVNAAPPVDQATVLFKGMFERGEGKANVQKGAYGQALAQAVLGDGLPLQVPQYIVDALKFICET